MRIFDYGLKRYANDPDYALAYVEFLSHLNGERFFLIFSFFYSKF